MTGLSGSGKSTIAIALERELHEMGILCRILDGDNIRTGIGNNLGFSADDRRENIRRVAEIARLFLNTGIVTICSFVSPTREIRKLASDIIGPENFFEVYVNASFEVCEQRDVKGLYKKARAGEIRDFTGLDAPFEAPEEAFLELRTDEQDLQTCKSELLAAILPKIRK
jgi:adenylylsulfate kinase